MNNLLYCNFDPNYEENYIIITNKDIKRPDNFDIEKSHVLTLKEYNNLYHKDLIDAKNNCNKKINLLENKIKLLKNNSINKELQNDNYKLQYENKELKKQIEILKNDIEDLKEYYNNKLNELMNNI